jgi:hypothetical protein
MVSAVAPMMRWQWSSLIVNQDRNPQKRRSNFIVLVLQCIVDVIDRLVFRNADMGANEMGIRRKKVYGEYQCSSEAEP